VERIKENIVKPMVLFGKFLNNEEQKVLQLRTVHGVAWTEHFVLATLAK